MEDERLIDKAAALISKAERLVAFSGSGTSEESGIPTFRDPGGLWARYNPSEVAGGDIFTSLSEGSVVPGSTVEFVSEMVSVFEKARPNPGHLALKDLQDMRILRSVITQNIDNLHFEAGNSIVIEVHGNVYRMACMNCGNSFKLGREEFLSLGHELVGFLERMDLEGLIKLASMCSCGGVCRLDVVNFGEPVQGLREAMIEAQNSDLFLILGTSGVVYPAASLPLQARTAGAKLIEINATECAFPDILDVCIVGKTGEVLPSIVERVRELRG